MPRYRYIAIGIRHNIDAIKLIQSTIYVCKLIRMYLVHISVSAVLINH